MYDSEISLTGTTYKPAYTKGSTNFYWGVLDVPHTQVTQIQKLGKGGIGAEVQITYTHKSNPSKVKLMKCFIRDAITGNSINLIQTGRDWNLDDILISKINVYKTMLTHYGDAINRNVKIILFIK